MDKNKSHDFTAVPAAAFELTGHLTGQFADVTKDGEATVHKIELLARTSQPIEHWWWGRVVHDMDGVMHKDKIPVDYVHDGGEVIGFVDEFKVDATGLILNGTLTPFSDTDRAAEVAFKIKAGVPYQASIFFGGDNEKYEYIPEKTTSKVNGYDFEGPGIIVRKWNLNGVAICPYGADANTQTKVFGKGDARRINITGVTQMSTTDANKETNQEPNAVEFDLAKAREQFQAEEAERVEAAKAEFKKIHDKFGAEIASEVYLNGGGYAKALELHAEKIEAENAELKKANKELSTSGGTPASFTATPEGEKIDAWKAAQKR
jgi:hypothetical protein